MSDEKSKMKWSFQVAVIGGTRVKLHLTFLLLLAWVGMVLGAQGGVTAAIQGVVFLVLVFFCVLLHEFGHVFAALRYGITTPKITLLPFGGIASMKRIPREPIQELVVSIAGPLVNVGIAIVLLIIKRGVFDWNAATHNFEAGSMIDRLLWVNIVLVLFNMIPAFPMDGGRVFRALLSFFMPREKATLIAARVGQVFAVAGGILAVFAHQPILFVIALFIYFTAKSEAAFVETEHTLEGLDAADASMGEFVSLKMDDTVHHAVDMILNTSQADFPVVNDSGQCVAIATRNDIIHTLRAEGANVPISEVVQTIPAQIELNEPAVVAWQKLTESKLPGAAVVDSHGRLVRWLTAENISELILTRSAAHDFLEH